MKASTPGDFGRSRQLLSASCKCLMVQSSFETCAHLRATDWNNSREIEPDSTASGSTTSGGYVSFGVNPVRNVSRLSTITERQINMTTNKMRPVHPGEILREEFLAPLGMSAHALAMALHVPAPRINDLVRERRSVTPDTALRLARFFDTTAEFWLNLQSSFNLKQAEHETGHRIREEVRPLAHAA